MIKAFSLEQVHNLRSGDAQRARDGLREWVEEEKRQIEHDWPMTQDMASLQRLQGAREVLDKVLEALTLPVRPRPMKTPDVPDGPMYG